jgi:hypothetical protein
VIIPFETYLLMRYYSAIPTTYNDGCSTSFSNFPTYARVEHVLPAEFQSIRKLNEYDIAKEPIQLTRVTKLPAIAFMSIENIFANK